MTYDEFKRHLGKAGLSVNAFAAWLHVRPNSVSNYAKKGGVPQSHAVIAVALGDARDRGVDIGELFARYGVRAKNSQGRRHVVTALSDYRSDSKRGRK